LVATAAAAPVPRKREVHPDIAPLGWAPDAAFSQAASYMA